MKKRQIQDIAAAALLALATAGFVGADGNETKTAALLARLRQALGGEDKLAAVKGLTVEADMRRVLPGEGSQPGSDMSGDIKLDIGGPSHYLFVDSFSPMPGFPPISIGSAIDGEAQWSGPLSAPSGPVMIRTAGSDPTQLRPRLEKDLTRLSIALLSGSGVPGIEFKYGGIVESPDGRAEVLEVKGPGGFEGSLYLDEKTARPMMIVYQEAARRMTMRREGPGARPIAAGHTDIAAPSSGSHEGNPGAPSGTAEMKEARMFLSDYKTANGISFPHAITIKVQDGQTEEWTVQKVKINPAFGADHFKKR
ncbi:MAG: hypothetical protein JJE39_05270 [Vicinamibacteria bacterium]|nr:hypothetical protein [Vicinamibacteria bacterium]